MSRYDFSVLFENESCAVCIDFRGAKPLNTPPPFFFSALVYTIGWSAVCELRLGAQP